VARLIDIEGIGKFHAEKLAAIGLETQEAFLKAAETPAGRADLVAKAGLTMNQVLNWANRADLARVNGIGSEYADLLEAAGVDTVPELCQRNATNLHALITKVNEEKILVRQLPTAEEVARWVADAQSLPRALHY
jgi:predicted flap endonuclease-1-like 5' DNA nuclease